MTRHDETGREAEVAGAAEKAEAPRWVPRTRVICEAVVAGIPAEREAEPGGGAGEGGAGGEAGAGE